MPEPSPIMSAGDYAASFAPDIAAVVEIAKQGIVALAPFYLRPFVALAWDLIVPRIIPIVSRETLLRFADAQRRSGYPIGGVAALRGLDRGPDL